MDLIGIRSAFELAELFGVVAISFLLQWIVEFFLSFQTFRIRIKSSLNCTDSEQEAAFR
jgi:hypothetical protein